MAEVIHEHLTHIRTPEGVLYHVRTVAEENSDGMWEGWLEFEPVEPDRPALRTERETSQANRIDVEQWACGLEPVYLEGAFERARVIGDR